MQIVKLLEKGKILRYLQLLEIIHKHNPGNMSYVSVLYQHDVNR